MYNITQRTQITKKCRSQVLWTVSPVITGGHFNLILGFVWVCTNYHTHVITPWGVSDQTAAMEICFLFMDELIKGKKKEYWSNIHVLLKFCCKTSYPQKKKPRTPTRMYLICNILPIRRRTYLLYATFSLRFLTFKLCNLWKWYHATFIKWTLYIHINMQVHKAYQPVYYTIWLKLWMYLLA